MQRTTTGLLSALLALGSLASETSFAQTVDAESAKVTQAFVGAWTLGSFESFGADGETTRRPMGGSIVYSQSGRMSAQLMPEGYEKRTAPANGTVDRRGYTAYYGRFEIDSEAGTVTHHVEGSINPEWVGRGLVRYYEIDGDTLKLSLRDEDGRTTGTLTWRRN